jgi:hypothetical protein
LDGWPGEVWVNISSTNVRNIMSKRLELASHKGCDAVDPDNMDGYVSLTAVLQKVTDSEHLAHDYRV